MKLRMALSITLVTLVFIPSIGVAMKLWVNRVETLRKWHRQGTGPAAAKVGKHPHYRKAEVDCWLPDQEVSA